MVSSPPSWGISPCCRGRLLFPPPWGVPLAETLERAPLGVVPPVLAVPAVVALAKAPSGRVPPIVGVLTLSPLGGVPSGQQIPVAIVSEDSLCVMYAVPNPPRSASWSWPVPPSIVS